MVWPLQCFDATSWVTGRDLHCKNSSLAVPKDGLTSAEFGFKLGLDSIQLLSTEIHHVEVYVISWMLFQLYTAPLLILNK